MNSLPSRPTSPSSSSFPASRSHKAQSVRCATPRRKAAATTKFFDKGIPVSVAATFVCPKPKAPMNAYPAKDLDKLARALLDALTGVVIADDSQVVELAVRKVYGLEPRTRVIVTHVREKEVAVGR